MREKVWWALRESPSIRWLQSVRGLGSVMTNLSYVLLPSLSQRTVEVQSGPGKGLLVTLNPRWETALWQGSYEAPVQAILQSLLGPSKVLYDVGGGTGFYSLLAGKLGSHAVVFEPDGFNAECIRHNVEINGLTSQIFVFEMAVFSHTGMLRMESASQDRGHGNAHVVVSEMAVPNLAEIPCTRLDDFIEEHRVPDVVKIDVEGAESEVLKGAQILFGDVRPYLICEIHDSSNAEVVRQLLGKLGYESRWLGSPDSFPVQLVGVPKVEKPVTNYAEHPTPR
jgi:FkbM family methyltransferase